MLLSGGARTDIITKNHKTALHLAQDDRMRQLVLEFMPGHVHPSQHKVQFATRAAQWAPEGGLCCPLDFSDRSFYNSELVIAVD